MADRHLDRRHQCIHHRRQQVEDRLAKLEEFWRRVERSSLWGAFPAWTGVADALSSWTTLTTGIPGFFETNPRAFLGAQVPLGADHAGFYSTEPLRRTLESLVDFSLINRDHPRLTVGAAHLRTSMMHFRLPRRCELPPPTSWRQARYRRPSRPCASTAKLYWDGGILSDTPTERIFDDHPRRNSLIFAVHLWNPTGEEPETIWEILHRAKDIQYSSRIASHIVRQRETHKLPPRHHQSARLTSPRRSRTHCSRSSPDIAATRACTSCRCSRRGSTARATPRTSTSPRTASAPARRPAMPTPTARCTPAWLGEFGLLDGVILHEPEPGAEPAAEILSPAIRSPAQPALPPPKLARASSGALDQQPRHDRA